MNRIYLDNAATSWPKPPTVYAAVDHALREWGVAAGRGTTREADEIRRMLAETRRLIADLIGVVEPRRITFHSHGTGALNAAIHGLLLTGDHVICTAAEHNSVLRPLQALVQAGVITQTILPVDESGGVDPVALERAWQPRTRLVVVTHASNVTGRIQPIAELGRIVRSRDGLFLLDAAQTLGTIPIQVDELLCDLLAAPGHKGLCGPLGTGVLYVGPRAEPMLRPTIQGGTGTRSESLDQPGELPDRLEAGNHNVPGLAGLHAGVSWVTRQTVAELHAKQRTLNTLWSALSKQAGLGSQTRSWGGDADSVGIVSLAPSRYDAHEVALILDQQPTRIQTRAGLHCAPLLHQALGTAATGGTLRLSWGPLTTPDDVRQALAVVQQVLSAEL